MLLEYRAVETASIQAKPDLRGVEERAVKIILFSSVRGGGHCLCRRGFNRRLISSHPTNHLGIPA